MKPSGKRKVRLKALELDMKGHESPPRDPDVNKIAKPSKADEKPIRIRNSAK